MSRRATVRGRPWRVRGGSSHGASSAHSASLRSVGYAFCLAMPPGYTTPQLLFQTGSERRGGLLASFGSIPALTPSVRGSAQPILHGRGGWLLAPCRLPC